MYLVIQNHWMTTTDQIKCLLFPFLFGWLQPRYTWLSSNRVGTSCQFRQGCLTEFVVHKTTFGTLPQQKTGSWCKTPMLGFTTVMSPVCPGCARTRKNTDNFFSFVEIKRFPRIISFRNLILHLLWKVYWDRFINRKCRKVSGNWYFVIKSQIVW